MDSSITLQTDDSSHRSKSLLQLVWVYGPLLVWMTLIFLASSDFLSASHTGSILKPILLFFFPEMRPRTFNTIHFFIRKAAHFTEYAMLAILAARAFRSTLSQSAPQYWFICALSLVAVYSLTDEYHQSFIPTRTSSIYDCMIDTAGGGTMLILLFLIGRWKKKKAEKKTPRVETITL